MIKYFYLRICAKIIILYQKINNKSYLIILIDKMDKCMVGINLNQSYRGNLKPIKIRPKKVTLKIIDI